MKECYEHLNRSTVFLLLLLWFYSNISFYYLLYHLLMAKYTFRIRIHKHSFYKEDDLEKKPRNFKEFLTITLSHLIPKQNIFFFPLGMGMEKIRTECKFLKGTISLPGIKYLCICRAICNPSTLYHNLCLEDKHRKIHYIHVKATTWFIFINAHL